MPQFHYQAVDDQQHRAEGEIEAATVQDAIAQLESRGLIVESIAVAGLRASIGAPLPKTAPPAVAAELQMASVLQAARPLIPALRAYADEMPAGRRRHELVRICSLLESNDAASIAARWKRLPEYWIPLLSAAAATNDPSRVLREFLDEAERAQALRIQWRRMLAYPAVVIALALAVLLFLSFAVIPIFRELFNDFGLRLPGLTQLVLNVAQFLTHPWWLTPAALVLLLVALFAFRHWTSPTHGTNPLGNWYDRTFRRSSVMSRFARFIAELLQAGVEPSVALPLAAETSGLPEVGEGRVGGPRSSLIAYAVSHDMPEATRTRLLKEVSNCFADQSRRRASVVQGLFGPLAVCFVGGCVLMVVLALFLPLVTLINNLSM
jgi:type IV pilus assembly protein PilC